MPLRIRSKDSYVREGVFISYARSDGSAISAALREQLEGEGISLWQDVIAMEGGRDWWLQITDALDQVEFMALVITPNALGSDTVQKEWRYARQQGVCVYPIKGTPDLDLAVVPRWLREKHFYDLTDKLQWRKFLNDLKTRCEVPRVPFMAEDLPADFVARPGEFDQLLAYLCNRNHEGPIAITAALRGAGGYGKTTLAKALCHNEDVLDIFDDGILWVTLGENPGDLAGRAADLVEMLNGERPGFSDVNAVAVRLRELLADRDVLIVIDDVWDSTHLTPFIQGAGRVAHLITTRNIDTMPPHTMRVDVDAMRLDEAMELLGTGLSDVDQPRLRRLAERLGEWPLLLKIANAVMRDRINRLGQDPGAAFGWINAALDRRGLTAFDARNAQARDQAVKKTIGVSINLLQPKERERYEELVVFPEDVEIPFMTLAKLWGESGGLDEFDAEALCEKLDRLSLLQRFDPNRRVISVHDVVRQYLIGEQVERLPALHEALLKAHRPISTLLFPGVTDWAELPPYEPYMWDHLAYHLTAAGRGDELILTAKNLCYLAAKTVVRDALAVEQDLLDAERVAMSDAVQRLLRRRFVQFGHILGRCGNRRDAEATLYSRLVQEGELAPLTDALEATLQPPYLRPLHSLPDLSHPALLRTLIGHNHEVGGCAISDDGQVIVSASYDRTVKVWDSVSGRLARTLTGHTDAVIGCTISTDGMLIISASHDKTIKVWELASGALARTLRGHNGEVHACAISRDGTLIVSASYDKTLRVWARASGALVRTLSGHTDRVPGCAISGDGSLIVSASYDQTLKVWDTASGAVVRTLIGHNNVVSGCVISRDGKLIVSASWDQTVKVWSSATGELVRTLTGHTGGVIKCAISADGRRIVSASYDRTVKVWDVASGALLRTLTGHDSVVPDCAISGDGSLIVSASSDKTVKVWDVTSTRVLDAVTGHTGGAGGCAISGDGTLVVAASGDKTVKVWDSASGALLHTLTGHTNSVTSCAISSDGSLIVSASNDKTVKVWNTASGRLVRTLIGHTNVVTGCAITGDGRLVISASEDCTVKVWEVANGALVRTLYSYDALIDCAFTSDGSRVVSASSQLTVEVWDLASRALVPMPILTRHRDWLTGSAISGDGRLIVSASLDQTLKVWNGASGALVQTLIGHDGVVSGCAISSDGRLIVSVSHDQTLKVWDSDSGECLTTLHVDAPLFSCAIHGAGDRIIAGGSRGVYFLRLVR